MYFPPKKIGVYFIFLISLMSCFILTSQVIPPNLPAKIKHISSLDGLSQVSIHSMVKDRNGYVWIGTVDGLNRFDGRNIIKYRHNPKDKNSLCGNFINTLYEDRKGRIWIGTINQGFCFYEPKKGIFIKPKMNDTFSKILNTSVVTDIKQDQSGCIWINTKKFGLIRLFESNDVFFEATIVPISKSNLITTALYISTDEKIWIGTENGEIYYSQKIGDRSQLPQFKPVENIKTSSRVNTFIDDANFIWIGTNNGLWNIEKKSMKVLYYDLNTTGTIKTRKYFVYSLAFTSPDELWVGAGNGLYRLQKRNKKNWFQQMSLYHEDIQNSISHNTIFSLLVDSHLVWVGTARNLDIFDFEKPKFHNITNELSNSIVFSIYKKDRDLWLGTAGGLNLFKNGEVYHFREDASNPNSIADNIVKSITPDNKGNLWFGTTKGISVINLEEFNPQNPIFICIYSNPNNSNALSDDNTTHVYLDRSNQIWITTNGQGINRFVGSVKNNDFRFQQFKHIPNTANTISSNNTYYITQNTTGEYWLGTENGLDKITVLSDDYSKITIKNYEHNSDDLATISSNSIKNIYFDKEGIMWVGTRFGFNKYDINTDSFQSYYTSDGLPNEWICFIQEDDYQNLWMGTNKGLACFNKKTNKISNFFVRDGIADNEFNSLANFKDKEGRIYTGNLKGLTSFNPLDVLNKRKAQDVLITDILKPKQDIKKSKNNINREMVRLNPLSEIPIQLKYDDFPLYIKFASPKSGPFEEPDYYYKLEPTDKEWNYLDERKEIQLLNLSSGDYSLLLAGGQNGEIWNEKTYKLQLKINPPWWKSILAYLLYSLLFLSLVYAFYRFSLSKKLEHQENLRLLELDELKTKLYGNITHELRTPLTVIMGMTDGILTKMTMKELKKFKPKLNILSRNTKKLLLLINQMLDLSKIESGKMELEQIQADIIPFIKVNLDSFHSLSTNKNIELIYYNEDDEIIMDFDPDKISTIVSNILSNAIKFTPEKGRIIFHVKKISKNGHPYLLLKVKDNGIGILEEDQKYIFDRFYQVETLSAGGTGIGLSLTKELIVLMNGNISVKSKLHQGTEFTIKIPITNQASKVTEVSISPMYLIEEENQEEVKQKESQQEELPLLLIIEDNKDVANFIASGLIKQYGIIFAKDGKEGIEKAFERIPDLIISDLMMPKVDGFKVCTVLKNDEKTSHIPIIMLTARTFKKDKIKGFAYGADAYLTKPFNKNELLIRIEQLILVRKRMHEKYQKTGFSVIATSSKEAGFINKCIKVIHKNLNDDTFKSAQLSFAVHLSESQFYRKIKAITNLSTAVFIRDIRLKAGKEMLQKTDKNISEIAYACGFSNPDWFSKSFKEKFGYTPSDFRQNL